MIFAGLGLLATYGDRLTAAAARQRALVLEALGENERAIGSWTRVAELVSSDATAYARIADLQTAMQCPGLAADTYGRAIAQGFDMYRQRAGVRRSMSDFKGAQADYQQALRRTPGDQGLWSDLAYTRRLG